MSRSVWKYIKERVEVCQGVYGSMSRSAWKCISESVRCLGHRITNHRASAVAFVDFEAFSRRIVYMFHNRAVVLPRCQVNGQIPLGPTSLPEALAGGLERT